MSEHLSQSGAIAERGDGYDYVRQHYGIEVEEGDRVAVDGRSGVVVRGVDDQYVHVRFDNGWTAPCHPTWRLEVLRDA